MGLLFGIKQNGNYTAEVIENNPAVRKLLYYGYGGPAAWGQFADNYDLKNAICPDDTYLTNDDVKYLLTHIFLSGAYAGDWNSYSINILEVHMVQIS